MADKETKKQTESKVHQNDGERLRIVREHAGKTQREMAKKLGISTGTQGNHENAHTEVPRWISREMYNEYGVDVTPLNPETDTHLVIHQMAEHQAEALNDAKPSQIAPELRIKTPCAGAERTRLASEAIDKPKSFWNVRTWFTSMSKTSMLMRERDSLVRQHLYSRPRRIAGTIFKDLFVGSLLFIFIKTLSLQAGFAFGLTGNMEGYMLLASMVIASLLFIPVLQGLPIGIKIEDVVKDRQFDDL